MSAAIRLVCVPDAFAQAIARLLPAFRYTHITGFTHAIGHHEHVMGTRPIPLGPASSSAVRHTCRAARGSRLALRGMRAQRGVVSPILQPSYHMLSEKPGVRRMPCRVAAVQLLAAWQQCPAQAAPTSAAAACAAAAAAAGSYQFEWQLRRLLIAPCPVDGRCSNPQCAAPRVRTECWLPYCSCKRLQGCHCYDTSIISLIIQARAATPQLSLSITAAKRPQHPAPATAVGNIWPGCTGVSSHHNKIQGIIRDYVARCTLQY